uniref:Cyclin-dependent kinase 5 activator n=1 Tax=Globodera rostochiensis TaxID=31243 RepID=A0A914IAL8_GLORO
MGAQLSADGASPGVSSLGSNGQKGGATPRSASERSLALSSSAASSSLHSVRLRTLSGYCSSASPPSMPHQQHNAFSFLSPREQKEGDKYPQHTHHEHPQHGIVLGDGRRSAKEHRPLSHGPHHHGSFFRWQSFARTLPNLVMRANPYGGSTAVNGGGSSGAFNRKRQQRQWDVRELLDANNNETVVEDAFAPFMPSTGSFVHSHRHFPQHSMPSGDDNEREGKKMSDAQKKGTGFSLKTSLRKSGALLSDEDSSSSSSSGEEEGEEGEDEGGEGGWRRDRWVEESGQFGWHCNNGNDVTSCPLHRPLHLPADSSATVFQQSAHLPSQKSHLPSKSLRFSLKRHLMGGHQQQKTAVASADGCEKQLNVAAGNGTVSSVLLAMATGQRPMRHASAEGTNKTGSMLDWNGNNCTTDGGQLVLPWQEDSMLSRKKIIQASSTELMRALGAFIGMRCGRLTPQFEPVQLTTWLRSVDRALILQGWQDVAFINPANLVFLFLLVRDSFALGECGRLRSLDELHAFVLLCLYISYSYMGNEISYPLKPFITEQTNRTIFWSQCVQLIKCHSAQMLRLNSSSAFFLEVFTELKRYSVDPADCAP